MYFNAATRNINGGISDAHGFYARLRAIKKDPFQD